MANPFERRSTGSVNNQGIGEELELTLLKDQVLCYNLVHMAQETFPDLGVIDAFKSMEGMGPHQGTPVNTRLALASVDPLVLDFLGTKIMGFDPHNINYLSAMYEARMGQGDLYKINVLGANLDDCLFHFEPHPRLAPAYGLV